MDSGGSLWFEGWEGLWALKHQLIHNQQSRPHSSLSCWEPQSVLRPQLTQTKVWTSAECSECGLSQFNFLLNTLWRNRIYHGNILGSHTSGMGSFCLAKAWCTEMATATWLAFHHMWTTRVNRPLCLGEFPSFPWGMTHFVGLCCPFCGMFSVLLDCLSLFEKTAAHGLCRHITLSTVWEPHISRGLPPSSAPGTLAFVNFFEFLWGMR